MPSAAERDAERRRRRQPKAEAGAAPEDCCQLNFLPHRLVTQSVTQKRLANLRAFFLRDICDVICTHVILTGFTQWLCTCVARDLVVYLTWMLA